MIMLIMIILIVIIILLILLTISRTSGAALRPASCSDSALLAAKKARGRMI